MKRYFAGTVSALAVAIWFAGAALAGTIVINTDTSDPALKQAFQELIDGFKEANPDVEVAWNVFDYEGYKTSIRNFLTADAPDIAAWYAGNRMAPYVEAGLLEEVSEVWADNGLEESFSSSAASMTMDGKKWGVPYTDDRVKAVFAKWTELLEPGYFVENHAALDWQDALPLLAQGKAGMYLIGNFAVAPLRDAGLTDDQLGFMQFLAITPDLPMAEDAPTDTLHIPANAKNNTVSHSDCRAIFGACCRISPTACPCKPPQKR